LKAPGTKGLNLKYVKPLSILLQFCFNFAFKISLRRYIKVMPIPQKYVDSAAAGVKAAALASVNEPARHG
jgi:hypothetical protein